MKIYKKIFIISITILIFISVKTGIIIKIKEESIYSSNGVENQRKIAATYMTMNNPFFEIINDEIRYIVEGNGDILITRDPALDLEKQIEEIYEFIDLEVDAIFINPVDWIGIKSALNAAKKAGIILIAIDTNVYDEDLISFTVVSDNYDAGVKCAEDLIKNKESSNIILLEHNTAKSAIDRIRGFEDTIKKDSKHKIVARSDCEGQLEIAMPIVGDLLEIAPDTNVIMALNDPSALGAIMALEEKNKKNIMVYGVDGSPEGKMMIRDNRMTATAAQFPEEIGKVSAEKLYDVFKGKTVEKKIVIPVELINSENID